jgi:hypothetical protein
MSSKIINEKLHCLYPKQQQQQQKIRIFIVSSFFNAEQKKKKGSLFENGFKSFVFEIF